jgi:hypothetical protein
MAGIRATFNGVKLEKVIEGVRRSLLEELGPEDTLTSPEGERPRDEVLARIANFQQAIRDVEEARRVVKVKLRARTEAVPQMLAFMVWYDASIGSKVGCDPDRMAKFGIPKVGPRRKLTSTEMLARVEKMRATRKARGTLGKRQRDKLAAAVETPPDRSLSVASPEKPRSR